MYNQGDLPFIGDYIKINHIDIEQFTANVFGGKSILNKIQPQYDEGQLYGVLISGEMWSADSHDDHIMLNLYLLDKDGKIIHDSCFLSNEDLPYIECTQLDRPQCINQMCRNIYVDQLKTGMKLYSNNDKVHSIRVTKESIFTQCDDSFDDYHQYKLSNLDSMNDFYKKFDGFCNVDDNVIKFRNGRKTFKIDADPRALQAFLERFFASEKTELSEAEKRRSKLSIVVDNK